jgi:HK97 family phage major capsid protein
MSDEIKNEAPAVVVPNELHTVKDGIEAIKEGLEGRNAKIEEIEARIDAIDAATARGAADLKKYTTGNDSKDAGSRALGAAVAQAYRKFQGRDISRDFDETNTAVVVPTPTFPGVTRLLEERSLPRQLARVIPMTSQTLVVPTVTSIVSGEWVDQGASVTSDATTTFGSKANSTVTAESVAVLGKISKELDEDAIVAMSSILGEIYADALATAENEAFLTHDGVTSGQPFDGLFEDANVTVSTIDEAAGATADTMAEVLTYSNLVTLLSELPVMHQQRAGFIMSPSVWAEVLKLVDGDSRPLINPNGFAQGVAPQLLGRPVYISDSAPAFNALTAADQKFILCGDYGTACVMGDRSAVELEVSDAPFFQTRERALLISERVGFKTILPGAIKALSTDIA